MTVKDDVWVGAWRPHKPRGTIAALYSNPGPKYALPGATGLNNHDPRMLKGPAFSFGTRHRLFNSDCSPGPGYLVPPNITRVGRDGTPAYSLYCRRKDPQLFQTPGPGRYFPEKSGKMAYHSPPAYSLSARTRGFRNDQTPGPAAYMLPPVMGPMTVNKASAPNFSLTGRSKIGSFSEDLQKTPGPGSYRVVDPSTYTQKAPQYSMIGRNSMPGDTTRKPGPGAHHPEQVTFTRSQAPSFSFGIRHSEFIAPLIPDVAD
ncbi:outer dense fiber protein 3-B-like [Clupea harengus]|uniref:Outer dense fiber protein 3-B n=1 Tax=Clupea harengus TaxID=7950 RepID=A0A6P3WFA4_CLUHA|nr:outer dense fiber protein 3-B [Clupea harengus]XP_042559842.1 outer dense fiber protein 3-B [Clupea harengus]XP_042562023.1 outer dense fiber protein 3-B-like [Clupea harengus]XP_042562024.1 outer dense fiber protein 3-B-like [Clupea harengus]